MPKSFRTLLLTLCALLSGNFGFAFGTEIPKKPHQVIGDLRQRMYAIGETNPKLERFIEAEQKAVAEIREYVRGGFDSSGLIAKNDTGQTPLIAAAFMGYSEVVSELLTSDTVKGAIDEANNLGMSAWLSSNLAYRQAMWACNPKVFDDPFAFVPLFVTQPYYLQPDNPYKKTRRVLEGAGANADLARAKQLWHDNCKAQSDATRKRVQESDDLLETLLAEGAETLARFVTEKQKQLAEKQQQRNPPPPSDYVPLDQIRIKPRFDSVLLTKENLAAEHKKCVPLIKTNTESMDSAVREFPRNNSIIATAHASSSKKFIYQGTKGLCLEFSANRYPIFAAEAFIGTANPTGVPPDVTDDWYMKIALRIATNGRAKVVYVTDKGTAYLASYWSDKPGEFALQYLREFKKVGEWENTDVDFKFAHPALSGFSETTRGDAKRKVKNFPLATDQ